MAVGLLVDGAVQGPQLDTLDRIRFLRSFLPVATTFLSTSQVLDHCIMHK